MLALDERRIIATEAVKKFPPLTPEWCWWAIFKCEKEGGQQIMSRVKVEQEQPLEKLKASLRARIPIEQDPTRRLELHVELNNLQHCANGCTSRPATDLDEQGRPVCCICNMNYRWGEGNRRHGDRRIKLSDRP